MCFGWKNGRNLKIREEIAAGRVIWQPEAADQNELRGLRKRRAGAPLPSPTPEATLATIVARPKEWRKFHASRFQIL
jgi:hypothetical protein